MELVFQKMQWELQYNLIKFSLQLETLQYVRHASLRWLVKSAADVLSVGIRP